MIFFTSGKCTFLASFKLIYLIYNSYIFLCFFQVNSFVGAFHDAVILYALALNETLEANGNITNGVEITKRMWNRTFNGKL